MPVLDQFSMAGKTVLVTGGEGLLGKIICETVRELNGRALSIDICEDADIVYDITGNGLDQNGLGLGEYTGDVLVNCAIGNQKPVETFHQGWYDDLNIGLSAAMRVTATFLPELIKRRGVILNIGSDLSFIAPTQSLYDGKLKPMSYSVVKHGIVGMTRYIAATFPVRCNCLCPGGIDVGQPFPDIPMKRLARPEEMKGPVAFLISNASSYMNGAVLMVDGGRTII